MTEPRSETFDILPFPGPLGAEVRGLDLTRDLSGGEFAAVREAWLKHIMLLFVDQHLSDADLVRFSRRFGALDVPPMSDIGIASAPDHPEVYVVSNVVEGGRPIGTLGTGEVNWHTIMSYSSRPPMAILLHAIEAPFRGGHSDFANMYMALEELPADLRGRIEGRSAKHDATTDSAGRLRSGAFESDDLEASPGARHPLILRHPDTRRDYLFLGRRKKALIDGLPRAESETLLDALWAHATRYRFTSHHRWRPGDLLLWDNRAAMYRRDGFDPNERRVVHRTQIRSTLFGY